MLLCFGRAQGSLLPTPSHRAASAAQGQGSAGPIRRRRKNVTLYETFLLALFLGGEF